MEILAVCAGNSSCINAGISSCVILGTSNVQYGCYRPLVISSSCTNFITLVFSALKALVVPAFLYAKSFIVIYRWNLQRTFFFVVRWCFQCRPFQRFYRRIFQRLDFFGIFYLENVTLVYTLVNHINIVVKM